MLARTTRSVRPTEAGQRLLDQVAPALDQIESGLLDAREGRDQMSGTLRLTAMEYPARAILVPALGEFLALNPKVQADIHVSDKFTDIVKGGFDAGVRFGSHVEKDMVAVPIGPNLVAAIVAAPSYYVRRGRPRRLDDLATHDCLNYRTASHGDLFRWLFRQGARNVEVAITGPATFNDAPVMIEAALAGLGLAYTFEAHVTGHLASGRLVRCLDDHCPVWSGYHMYYPGRRQKSVALAAFVEAVRYRGPR